MITVRNYNVEEACHREYKYFSHFLGTETLRL